MTLNTSGFLLFNINKSKKECFGVMYSENKKLNAPKTSEVTSRECQNQSVGTALKKTDLFRFLHKLLICIAFLSFGLFISYSVKNQTDVLEPFAESYFSFFSDNEESGLFYKFYTALYRDILTFVLLILSALTFFYNALGSILLSANSLIYGICAGVLIFSRQPHRLSAVYIAEAVCVLMLFIYIMTRAAKFNENFIRSKQDENIKSDGRIFISQDMKRYLTESLFAVLIYAAIKFISCMLLINL